MIPYLDFGGSGASLHFLHANGYPPAGYRPLMDLFKNEYHTCGMSLRPLWPDTRPSEIEDWSPFSEDLLRFLDEQDVNSVIGTGHSIGATVTLRAALREPDRFRALVLMEPVLFPRYLMLAWNLIRRSGLGYRLHPLIRGAGKRRREFSDLEAVFRGYRKRDVFRFFSDENLRTFIAAMTRPTPGGGYELVFSPEWEARIYYTGIWHDWDLWNKISTLQIPTLILRGAETDTFWKSTAHIVKKKNCKIKIVTLENATHLLPLERPEQVFELTQAFLKEVL
jgi:pimeloyl-ACP methyl ester carboxylesterase